MTASILNMKKNKKGQMTMFILFGVILVFIIILFLLVVGVMSIKINNAFAQDVDIGQVNMATLNAQTFGQYNTMVLRHADFIGICAVFGMVLGLFLSSYFLRGKFPKWAILLDIFIIIAVFIFALYLSQSYNTLVNALADAGETFLEDYMPKTSLFILNLPIFIVIIGAIMMILFHSSLPRRREEGAGGFQGI